jgi:transposase
LANKRRKFTPEFKKEAIDLVANHGYSVAEAARNLSIRRSTLDRWRREQRQQQENAFPGTGHLPAEAAELKRLREENRKLRLERDILKKAAAFFARESG